MGTYSQPYAVLMGDIVGSAQHDVAALHSLFNATIDRQNSGESTRIASPLTITLGDEFQGLATTLSAAFDIVHHIRLDLLEQSIECRFAIGEIDLKTPLNSHNAWNMMGPGLAETRDRLNEKLANTVYRFVVPDHPVLETLLDASGASLTAIERGWTPTQRHDIRARLGGETPAEIALDRKVSVHSVYKVQASGNFDLYLTHTQAVRQTLAALDKLKMSQGMIA